MFAQLCSHKNFKQVSLKRQPWHTYTNKLNVWEQKLFVASVVSFFEISPLPWWLIFWRNLQVIQQSPRITAVDTIRIIPNVKDSILRPMKMLRILRFWNSGRGWPPRGWWCLMVSCINTRKDRSSKLYFNWSFFLLQASNLTRVTQHHSNSDPFGNLSKTLQKFREFFFVRSLWLTKTLIISWTPR